MLQRLHRLDRASRADLAKAAGISQPTAGKIIDHLLALGVLQELDDPPLAALSNGPEPLHPGRPGRLLQLDAIHPRFIAIELGVEHTGVCGLPLKAEAAAAAPGGKFSTGTHPDTWAKRLREYATAWPASSLWGVLVSVPGVVDEAAGRVLYSPNLHWTETVSLVELIQQTWRLPVVLVQEIRALALGHLTAVPEAEDFLLVDFGEGVGGAVIEGSQLFSHPLPLSGELGHTPVPGNPRLCGCGAHGCVETLLSRRGLAESFSSADLSALAGVIATEGLPPWLRDALEAMGAIIAGALNVLGLRRVVITGHLTELPPLVLSTLGAAVRRGAMWARFGEVICEAAPRRRLAGLVAAGLDRLLFPVAAQGALAQIARRRMVQTAGRVKSGGRRGHAEN